MKEGLAFFTDTWITVVGLMLFFIFFVSMLIRVFRIKGEYFKEMSNIPLKDKNS